MDSTASSQTALNAEVWAAGDFLGDYAGTELRAPESALLEAFSVELAGRVLELGCGAGRVTRHLVQRARSVHAVDISPRMVERCRQTCPQASCSVGDLGELTSLHSGSFEAVVASFCVLDVLDDAARRRTLEQIHRLLAAGGVLIASSHNLAYAPHIPKPTRLRSRSPARMVRNLARVPLRVRNHRRLRRHERFASDHAVLVDDAHDFSLLHYYIARDAEERQLAEHGFALLECLDLSAAPVRPGDAAGDCPELHYAARRLG